MSVVVTAGRGFLDIDALAGCIAYAELLNLKGITAVAASTARMNDSVSLTARNMSASLLQDYVPQADDQFVLIDISEPEFFDSIVRLDGVIEVIDHHLGYEQFWNERAAKADIELIGAACTQVYERWVDTGLIDQMTEQSARLLSLGILDNTLNFGASVSTERDRKAYEHLSILGKVPQEWVGQYFQECERSILNDPETALINDTKMMNFPGYSKTMKVGQLVVWSGEAVLEEVKALCDSNNHMINLVSLSTKRSYIISRDAAIQGYLTPLLDGNFVDATMDATRLWLRKEIMKAALDIAESEHREELHV